MRSEAYVIVNFSLFFFSFSRHFSCLGKNEYSGGSLIEIALWNTRIGDSGFEVLLRVMTAMGSLFLDKNKKK